MRAGEVREEEEEEAAERETCWEGGGEEEAFMGVSSESGRGGGGASTVRVNQGLGVRGGFRRGCRKVSSWEAGEANERRGRERERLK